MTEGDRTRSASPEPPHNGVADSETAAASDAEPLASDADLSGAADGNVAGRVKGPWSPEEDAVLSRLVSKFGARNWSMIARGIPGRSGKSCRLRWCNQLDPCVKRKPFTGNLYSPLILLSVLCVYWFLVRLFGFPFWIWGLV